MTGGETFHAVVPYGRPHAFTGGTIRHAIVDVSGDHFVDLELEALAMMKRE